MPAVYFVSPTLSNIRRIAEDLRKCLYESFHLNFVEPLPRALLEELAASVAQDATGDLIEQVRTNAWFLFFPNHCHASTGSGSVFVLYRTFAVPLLSSTEPPSSLH